ncbi:MAG: 1-acyl-sn-glycerol-3-phosphate acyltransferase [Clostridia bacterium]|nr:1-acyl-sn-glycerol-3-phosphate acyltransferase [Clostridia bacterium]
MLYVYIVAAAAAVPLLNNFFPILRQNYSVWLVPCVFAGVLLSLLIIHLLIFVICGYIVDLKKPQEKQSRFYRGLVKITLPMLFSLLRVKVESTGTENTDDVYPAMLVCNHLDNIDPAVILNELPELKLGFIGKKEIYTDMPFVARYMHKLNCLPIDRENNREAAKTIIEAIRLIKNKTASVGIFPEGYTSLDGKLHDFRNGAFKIATKSGCPVVVCTVVGTHEAVKNLFKRKNTIYFDVLEVISGEEILSMTTSEISDRIHKEMRENIEKREAQLCLRK